MKKHDKKGKFLTTHGKSFSSEYRSWAAMKKRCLNPDRGHIKYLTIQICKEWIDSFEAFMNDMGPKPDSTYTIERIDNKKGYYPDNCKWATRREQNRNYSLNRLLTCDGKTMCVTEWAEFYNIPRHRIFNRLAKGWSIDKAIKHNLSL